VFLGAEIQFLTAIAPLHRLSDRTGLGLAAESAVVLHCAAQPRRD
jgi:hypothetical protein